MFSKLVYCLLIGASNLLVAAAPAPAPSPGSIDTASLKHIANVSYADASLSGVGSIFSPRMDFEQWRPLTGRGDPLHNDPTYDYEPPLLDRVHYWVDDSRVEREHYPERKHEVLMLGVSSRKPSAPPRPAPSRRPHRPPNHHKYEDYTYKLSDHYPMTILVPPPPPPPGHKPSLYILNDKPPTPNQIKVTDPPKPVQETTSTPEHLTSLFAFQEANLIYQSSTTNQNSIYDANHTQPMANHAVSSDYAGWGPTTPLDDVATHNDTHNFIFNDQTEFPKQPYSFYKPMFSEAPPPLRVTPNPLLLPTFVPTALPPLPTLPAAPITTAAPSQPTYIPEHTTAETYTFIFEDNEETTTEKNFANMFHTTPTGYANPTSSKGTIDMISSMMTMPLVNGPDRPEDNLYAHASENLHVYKEQETEDPVKLETMQTMQPPAPPVAKDTTQTSHKQPFHVNTHMPHAVMHNKPAMHTHDPYLHMRFTTPSTTVPISVHSSENTKPTTEDPAAPMYLIIQGHSKVKTYGSKQKPIDDKHTSDNEIPKSNETNEVRHLHPIKGKYSLQKSDKVDLRTGKAQSLRALVDEGRGSIEIQETDLGIKYDVSDGSEVPVEIYRKGIVDNDENDYSKLKESCKEKNRTKRQASVPISIDEVLPFDEDRLDGYVYNYLKGNKNATGMTGLLANFVTGGVGSLFDDLEEDDDEDDYDPDEESKDDDDDDDR